MSYLTLPAINLADFSKATISLWFRFSQDSVDKAAPYQSPRLFPGANPEPPGILNSTMPLVTFGKAMGNVYMPEVHSWEAPGGSQVIDVHSILTAETPSPPSHIGILCGERPTLVMHFQMDTRAAVQGLVYQITEVFWTEEAGPGGGYTQHTVVEDISQVRCAEPESFRIEPDFEIEVDKWHHLLVSFDFSDPVSVIPAEVGADYGGDYETTRGLTIKSWGKIWYAFDNENMKGKDKVGRWPGLPVGGASPLPTRGYVPQDENGIIPQNAESAIFVYTPGLPDPNVTGGGETPNYNWEASQLPMNGNPVGLPASADHVDTVYHCEMAEFQMWGGLALDTAVEANRRAFIDFDRDQDGDPISNVLKPVKPKQAEELMFRKPDILLHGSSKWKEGYNTGSTGVEEELTGEIVKIPSGQFTPVAGIKKYKPEPSLSDEPTA